MGQGLETRIDVGHQFLDDEVFPVAGHRGIDVPGAPEWRVHIDEDENDLIDHASRDRSIEECLGALVTALESGGEEVDHRMAHR